MQVFNNAIRYKDSEKEKNFKNMDISIFELYAQVGKKSKSIETLIKYLKIRYE